MPRACASLACAKTFQVNTGDKVKVIGKTADYYVGRHRQKTLGMKSPLMGRKDLFMAIL